MTISCNCKGFGEKIGKCKNNAKFPNISPYCSNCAGKSFEIQVSRLFKIQGYTVTNNIKLSSTQNDFFAKLTYGWIDIGVLVECKWKFNSEDTVNGADVRKFNGSFNIFNKQNLYGKAEKALIITNGKFAPEAYEVANNLNIELYTHHSLLKKLINFEPYLKQLINNFASSNLVKHYIDLESKSGMHLLDEIDDLLIAGDENALIILGDYGTGKTSFCLKLGSFLAQKALKGEDVPIPILIQLRDYSKAVDMEQLITDILINKSKIPNGSFETFMELLNHGYFIIIFDGFDEISKRIDYSTKYRVFTEICRFASKNSKILVTCRNNFFNQREEFEKIFKASPLHFEPNRYTVNFSEVEIADLKLEQILHYIETYKDELLKQGFCISDFIDTLKNTHDLFDLAKRPVLLNLIMETIPKLITEKGSKINEAKIYSEYTSYWLNREEQKGKTLIKSSEKLLFTQELAWNMFNNSIFSIHYTKLPLEIKRYFKVDTSEDVDYFSHDIQSCSFLHRDDEGNYKFIHNSFMEYFIAYKILDKLSYIITLEKKSKIKVLDTFLGQTLITLEVGRFLKALFEINAFDKRQFIRYFSSMDLKLLSLTAYKNSISIISKLDMDILPYLKGFKDLEGADLSYTNLTYGTVKGVNFLGTSFYKSHIRNVNFVDCCMLNTLFTKSLIKKSIFDNIILEASDLSMAKVSNSSFIDTNLSFCKVYNTEFLSCDFETADFSGIQHDNMTVFNDCSNMDTVFGIPYALAVD